MFFGGVLSEPEFTEVGRARRREDSAAYIRRIERDIVTLKAVGGIRGYEAQLVGQSKDVLDIRRGLSWSDIVEL